MITKVTDVQIAETFKVGINTLHRWKKDTEKYPHRYELYKFGTMLRNNNMNFFDILSLVDRNEVVENELVKLENEMNEVSNELQRLIR